MDIKAILYVRAFVADNALRTQSPGDVEDVTSHHLVAAHPDGAPYALPVVTQGAAARAVYFPRGCWSRPDTGERFTGPATRTVAAPVGTAAVLRPVRHEALLT